MNKNKKSSYFCLSIAILLLGLFLYSLYIHNGAKALDSPKANNNTDNLNPKGMVTTFDKNFEDDLFISVSGDLKPGNFDVSGIGDCDNISIKNNSGTRKINNGKLLLEEGDELIVNDKPNLCNGETENGPITLTSK